MINFDILKAFALSVYTVYSVCSIIFFILNTSIIWDLFKKKKINAEEKISLRSSIIAVAVFFVAATFVSIYYSPVWAVNLSLIPVLIFWGFMTALTGFGGENLMKEVCNCLCVFLLFANIVLVMTGDIPIDFSLFL